VPVGDCVYDAAGAPIAFASRPIGLDAGQIAAAAAWSRDPHHADRVHTTIARSSAPSLVLDRPRGAAPADGGRAVHDEGFVAEEIPSRLAGLRDADV
jgi:hypothetical protein